MVYFLQEVKNMPLIKWLSVCLLFLCSNAVVSSDFATVVDEPFLSFYNQSGLVKLYETDRDGIYQSNIGIELFLNKRIIVEAKKHSFSQLNEIQGVSKTQILAELEHTQIVLLTPKAELFIQVFNSLKNELNVVQVQPDFAIVKESSFNKQIQEQPFKLDAITLKDLPLSSCSSPTSKRIAIIDDSFNFEHPLLSGLDFILAYDADKRATSKMFQQNGHASMVTATIAQQLSDGQSPVTAQYIALQQSSTLTSAMILAFSISQKMNAQIINTSWTLPFLSDFLSKVIDHGLVKGGVDFVVVSAGNHSQPACEFNHLAKIKGVTIEGAHTTEGAISGFSNYGQCVDIYAPEKVVLNHKKGTLKALGTSSAAAMVSGELARLLSCGLTKAQIHKKLQT
tara:strand:+ start:3042 stop:4229 length:1188 start_codon:yes stop_codon:yes gene_type:complete